MLTPANLDAERAVLDAIMEQEAKLALNPQLTRQFLEVLYGRYFSLATGTAFLEVRGKREGEGMTFRKFYPNPEALLNDMPTWDPAHNYWVGVALRKHDKGGKKEDCAALTATFGDVDCGTAGHKEVTKYQTKDEALGAIEEFPLKPTMLIDSGGGYQLYWVLLEPLELNNGNLAHLERINRGLAFALEGDVAATDAARILRLPGTFNMKLAGNPRPVKIVWCEPERVYSLTELAKYEAKPQSQAQERRQGPQEEAGGYESYVQNALADELAKLSRTTADRNIQLNKSAFALGQLVGAGVLDRGSVEADLHGVAASIGLTGAEIRATIRSGLDSGVREPRELPEKQSKSRKQKKTVPPLIKNLDIASIYAQETGLSLQTDPPQVDKEGFTQCSVLYKPEDPNRTAFVNIGQGERRGYYVEMEDGKTVIGGNLCQTIAVKGSGKYMTPKDVYKYLQKKVGQKWRPPRESAERGQAVPKECGHYYSVLKGCHNLVLIGESENQEKPLSNFVAQISDEVTRDDGAKVNKEFIITGYVGDLQLQSARVPTKDFDAMKWVRQEWGAAASITPARNNAAHLPNAILSHSRGLGINRQTLYAHTGWRQINGVWRYIHGGGGIGPGEPVAVELGENLSLYRLPEPGGLEAAQASLRFLGIGPWEITAPLWSIVHLAPVADLLKIDFSLWLYGPTGSLKSTVAALALAHFGPFTRLNLPGSWFSTVNSLEKLTFILKDTICVIDDFCPPANQKESHAMAERAGRIIYQAGNRSARGRLGPDLMARPNYYPRSLIVSTGETLLPGQRGSATARYLGIEFDQKRNPIDKARLTDTQGEAHLYSAAMAAYLQSLAPRLDDVQDEIRYLWTGYRTAFQNSSHHSRIPEIQAWLAVGFELGLRFQVSVGAITPDQSDEMLDRAWQIFKTLGETHSRIIQGDRPTLKFLAVLHELFLQGRIYAKSTTGGPPPRGFGWDNTDLAYNAEFVGWIDGEMLYLMPETTVRVVQEAIRRQGDFLALGRNDMLAALAREGFIEPDKKKGKNTQVKWIEGGSKRVICLPVAKMRHDAGMENEQK